MQAFLDELIRHARVLPLDIVQAKGNGHAGTATSLMPLATVLYQQHLVHNPADPAWPGRDRFVLSAGHASLLLYVQLYLHGYGLTMDDLRRARTIDSLTPGHPERGLTPGVETTTGPLGQGLANAVGMALDARRVTAMLDPDGGTDSPFRYRVWCLVSDGDLMEGISHEAGALAGHLRLGDLIVLWDDNRITIEGSTGVTTSEDVVARFAAYGFRTLEVNDCEDLTGIDAVLTAAASSGPYDRPTFVRLRSRIGNPMPAVGGTAKAHAGRPGQEEIRATKQLLGLDPDEHFAVPAELLAAARRQAAERGAALQGEWTARYQAWRAGAPADRVALLDRLRAGTLPDGLWDDLPDLGDQPVAVRSVTGAYLRMLGERLPELWGGSADLADTAGGRLSREDNLLSPADTTGRPGGPGGRQIHYGIREHAMGAITNGIALGGLTRPFANGYLVFSDYLRPALRLAALMQLPAIFTFSHDSVAVGEDGPTHQPVEQLSSLRLIPGLAVVRPADPAEVLGVWQRVIERPEGPVALVSCRQEVPQLVLAGASVQGTRRGGYVVRAVDRPDAVLMATGSEVHLAVAAAERLAAEGLAAQVVSLPCWEWFEAEPADYRRTVLRPEVAARVAVEAGSGGLWWKYLGTAGECVSVEHFGQSGPGAEVLRRAGITVEAVVAAARASLRRAEDGREG